MVFRRDGDNHLLCRITSSEMDGVFAGETADGCIIHAIEPVLEVGSDAIRPAGEAEEVGYGEGGFREGFPPPKYTLPGASYPIR